MTAYAGFILKGETIMKQQAIVAEQFGSTANAYLSSKVHAQGKDLERLREIAGRHGKEEVLDLGCGAGHASFAVASVAGRVTAYDLSQEMLDVVARAARERGFANIVTRKGAAETLPFADAAFDIVVSRFSAHHWMHVPAALNEVARVLKPEGVVVFIDIVAPELPMNDTMLQAVEVLRDVSHVRDYRVSEWMRMFADSDFELQNRESWKLEMAFDEWVARMRTPPERIAAIRSLWDAASDETRSCFAVKENYSFSIDATLFEARKRGGQAG
jgi:ubiquinone/menaquinone biosynthesis C-methylase UbiE